MQTEVDKMLWAGLTLHAWYGVQLARHLRAFMVGSKRRHSQSYGISPKAYAPSRMYIITLCNIVKQPGVGLLQGFYRHMDRHHSFSEQLFCKTNQKILHSTN